jgi:type IV secretory pathway TraG/TraD family ATPase VirD4
MKALHDAGRATNHELYTALTHGALDDLHDFLENTQAARLLDPKAGAMPSNLIATVTSKLAAWPSLPDPISDAEVFSIRDFVHGRDDDAWLFLSTSEDQRPLLKPLLSLWSDIAATAILTLEKTHESKIWFVLDEVASLQKLPALPGLLERGAQARLRGAARASSDAAARGCVRHQAGARDRLSAADVARPPLRGARNGAVPRECAGTDRIPGVSDHS